jgi:hypothetical protein
MERRVFQKSWHEILEMEPSKKCQAQCRDSVRMREKPRSRAARDRLRISEPGKAEGGSLTVQLPIHLGMEGAREDGEVAGVCGLRVCEGGSEALYGYLGS